MSLQSWDAEARHCFQVPHDFHTHRQTLFKDLIPTMQKEMSHYLETSLMNLYARRRAGVPHPGHSLSHMPELFLAPERSQRKGPDVLGVTGSGGKRPGICSVEANDGAGASVQPG